MALELVERLALGQCRFCGSFFEIGETKQNRWSKLSRENFQKAVSGEKGLMFWNMEISERKRKLGMRVPKDRGSLERRFICPDCIQRFFAQVSRGMIAKS
jgi:hypothetical protein